MSETVTIAALIIIGLAVLCWSWVVSWRLWLEHREQGREYVSAGAESERDVFGFERETE